MGLDWNFFRITPEQYTRLLSAPTMETLEAIHEERFKNGLGYAHSPRNGDPEIPSFDTVYHLGLRTDVDELDTLMTFEEDDGPIVLWPLGGSGVQLSSLQEMLHLLNPEEVQSIAPSLRQLSEVYLHQRYLKTIEEFSEEAGDLEEIYPELQECFRDLTDFVQIAAKHGEAILWNLS